MTYGRIWALSQNCCFGASSLADQFSSLLPTAEGLESSQASEIKEGRGEACGGWWGQMVTGPRDIWAVVSRQVPFFSLNSVLYYTVRDELDPGSVP